MMEVEVIKLGATTQSEVMGDDEILDEHPLI